MRCSYCEYEDPRHNEHCPTKSDNPHAMDIWEEGYDDGLESRPSTSRNPIYILGWIRGDCRADEITNREH